MTMEKNVFKTAERGVFRTVIEYLDAGMPPGKLVRVLTELRNEVLDRDTDDPRMTELLIRHALTRGISADQVLPVVDEALAQATASCKVKVIKCLDRAISLVEGVARQRALM